MDPVRDEVVATEDMKRAGMLSLDAAVPTDEGDRGAICLSD